MAEIDPVIFKFKADVDGYVASVRRATDAVDRNVQLQESRIRHLEGEMRRASGSISTSFKGLAGSLAAAFTGRELIGLLDTFTRFQNSLRVAGVAAGDLQGVTDRLFASSQRYGVSLEATGALFGKISNASKELGASQEQVFTATNAVAAALKVSGGSAESSAGALLQLGQALGGSKIQAEEYNSLIDGLHPLLEAVAQSSDKYGGSVAKLTAAVKSGQVTTQEFFALILKGAEILEGRAAKASLTLAAGLTNLTGALTKYFGEADQANGVSAALGEALGLIGKNLDTLIPALAVVGGVMAGRFAAGLVATAVSSRAAAAALELVQLRALGAGTSLEVAGLAGATAGRGLLAAFGGPVGLAVTALTLGLGYLAVSSSEADAAAEKLSTSIDSQTAKFADLHKRQAETAASTNNLTDAQRSVLTATAALTGEVGSLASAWGRVAAQAKAAAIEEAKAAEAKALANYRDARTQRASAGQAVYFDGFGAAMTGQFGTAQAALDQRRQQEAAKFNPLVGQAAQNYLDAKAEREKIERDKLADFRSAPTPAAAGKGKKTKAKGSGAGASGPTAEQMAENSATENARLDAEILRAKFDLAGTAEDRADLARKILDNERDTRLAEVDRDDKLNAIQKGALRDRINKLYGAPERTGADGSIVAQTPGLLVQLQLRDQAAEARRRAIESAAAEKDVLDAQLANATTLDQRREISERILKKSQEIESANLEEAIANHRVADAKKARADLEEKQLADTKRLQVDNLNPIQAYAHNLDTRDNKQLVQQYVVDELQHVRDGIAGAIQQATGIKDPLINSLISLLIENILIKPIADALAKTKGASGGGGGLSGIATAVGGGIGGVVGGVLSVFGSIFGRASGGYVAPGQMVRVNESSGGGKVEGFMSQSGGKIVPLGQMNALAQGGGNAPAIVQLHVAEGTLFEPRVQAISGKVSVQIVRASAPGLIDAGAREALARAQRPRI